MVCRDCHGDGEVECHDCHGDGKVYCPTCKGKGEQKCPDCNGYGKVDCRECNGIGHHSDGLRCHYCINGKVLCNKCRGSGKVPCNKCRGRGKVDCMNCQGDGTVKCSTCRGKGSLICNDCNGHGRTIRYRAVMQEFTFSKRANYFANVDMLNYYCPLKAEGGKTVCLEHLLFGVRGCFFNSKPPSVKEREARR